MLPFSTALGGPSAPHARPSSGCLSGVAGARRGPRAPGFGGAGRWGPRGSRRQQGCRPSSGIPLRCRGPGASHCRPPGTEFALPGAGGGGPRPPAQPARPGAASRAAPSHERLPTLRWPAASSAQAAPLYRQSAGGGCCGSWRCCGHPAGKEAQRNLISFLPGERSSSPWAVPYFWPSSETSSVGERGNLHMYTRHTVTDSRRDGVFPFLACKN